MSNYKDILGSTLKLNKIEEEQIRSTRTNVWLENDSSLTSGIAENSTLSSSSESRVSSVTEAIMTELVDGFKRGASAMVRIIIYINCSKNNESSDTLRKNKPIFHFVMTALLSIAKTKVDTPPRIARISGLKS